MLEKLIELHKENKNIDSIEYWINELEEEKETYRITPFIDLLQVSHDVTSHNAANSTDQYILYINSLNNSSNVNLQALKLLFLNYEKLEDIFKNTSNTVGEIFLKKVPFAMIELLKLCSRLFYFQDSAECREIRTMTLKDDNYLLSNNTRIMLSTAQSNFTMVSKSEYNDFFNFMNNLTERDSKYESICGTWKANENEDVVSRHILMQFSNQFTQDYSINNTLREFCISCSSLCGLSSKVYSDWHVELYKLNPTVDTIYSVGLLISILFLLLTSVTFFILPYLRKTLHGKCTLFHLISMITAYTTLTVPQLYHNFFKDFSKLCIINGHLMQYGFLAMFFWLNVLCFDILLAFCFLKNRKSIMRTERKEKEKFKFVWYCCYGWGGPLVILIITIILEYSNIINDQNHLKPDIGGPKCFFQNKETQWTFLYGPIGCLILANLIMFSITAFQIYKHSRDSDVLHSNTSTTNKGDNNRLKVYINLFILMGVNWATEALSWILPTNKWFSYITDITTTLQGIVVFILFVCKPRIIREIKRKFGLPVRQGSQQASSEKTVSLLSKSSNKSSKNEQDLLEDKHQN